MHYIFKLLILIYTIFKMSISYEISPTEIIILLVVISFDIYREKYNKHEALDIIIALIEATLIAVGARYNSLFIILLAIGAYDFIRVRIYFLIIPILLFGFFTLGLNQFGDFSLLIVLSCFFSFVTTSLKEKETNYKESYDRERQYRYDLEQSRIKLINMSKEIVYITEVKERNRIAREIHDTVGHKIAGVLLQLQASFKLRTKDNEKSDKLLKDSIENLSDTLIVLRNTVHNIKPKDKVGIEYIKEIIHNFSFCTVDFSYKGDFNNISPNNLEVISLSIKEALTNASKHSQADKIIISIDVYEKFIRLFIKDNGTGCENIKEGLGISGMRERLTNIGGSISIDSRDGFMIVAIIPIENIQGGVRIEGTYSR
ncbi:Signal transduction histidine kinase [Proteiniborus ethanoligenes]|uniref:histidine kinase n=1 Tax=Proteiniborus ethanoligenes TaxID=415015 RepID=A0A1H3R7F3_9FIRM|nr:sensor histidine kinase [Proteiniborus ethanoligenes]SDZ21181.1 Signal transduction histidine kinase [Proteiniborus ethanoligenes]